MFRDIFRDKKKRRDIEKGFKQFINNVSQMAEQREPEQQQQQLTKSQSISQGSEILQSGSQNEQEQQISKSQIIVSTSQSHDEFKEPEKMIEQQEIMKSEIISQSIEVQQQVDKEVDKSEPQAKIEQSSTISISEQHEDQFKSEYFNITEIKPSPDTHKVIIINSNESVYPIIQFNEEYESEDKDLQCTNEPGLLICQTKQEQPCYEYEERMCQKHHLYIEHICLEVQCQQKAQFLLCSKCIKLHKSHNFVELQEVLHTVKKRQRQFNEQEQLFEEMQKQSQMKLKIIKSKVMSELLEIEKKLEESFDELKAQLFSQRELYQTIILDVIEGGITKLNEGVGLYSNQFTSSDSPAIQNTYLKGFIQKFDEVSNKMNTFSNIVLYKKEYHTIQVDNFSLEIEASYLQNLDYLDQQIKIQFIKQNQQQMISKNFLLIKEQEAIRLAGNLQSLDLEKDAILKIVSYQQL